MSLREGEELGKAIDAYLGAIRTGDIRLFERAFYPDSVVIDAGENDPRKATSPIADFAKGVKSLHDQGKNTEEIPLGMTISYVGCAANVRLDFELKIGDQTLYGSDYFNLVKRNGQWKISQKIYYVTHAK
jgi:ketosteroid isomerase-like protein